MCNSCSTGVLPLSHWPPSPASLVSGIASVGTQFPVVPSCGRRWAHRLRQCLPACLTPCASLGIGGGLREPVPQGPSWSLAGFLVGLASNGVLPKSVLTLELAEWRPLSPPSFIN